MYNEHCIYCNPSKSIRRNEALIHRSRRIVEDDKCAESVGSDDSIDEVIKALKDKNNNEDSDHDDSGGPDCDSTDEEEITLM